MSLESLLTKLKVAVSPVAAVQSNAGAGLGCNVDIAPGVAAVAEDVRTGQAETSGTAQNASAVSLKTPSIKARTPETPETAQANMCQGETERGAEPSSELAMLMTADVDWEDVVTDESTLKLDAERRDVSAAWSRFRALAQGRSQEASVVVRDDMVTCYQCANRTGRGRCMAAWRGEIDAYSRYAPVPDVLRRCEAFARKAASRDPDFT